MYSSKSLQLDKNKGKQASGASVWRTAARLNLYVGISTKEHSLGLATVFALKEVKWQAVTAATI